MKYFIPILICCITQISVAQPYRFSHITTAEGLLSDLRLVMTEDRQGRLWIGSDEGINIFDGQQLTTFNQTASFFEYSSRILQIYCDKKGRIWIATPLGIFYKNETDNQFFQLPLLINPLADYIFFGETSTGELLIAGKNEAYILNKLLKVKKLTGLDSLFEQYKSLGSFEKFTGDKWLMGFRSKLLLVNMKEQRVIRELVPFNTWCSAKVNDSIILTGSFAHDTISLVNVNTGARQDINDWPATDGKRIGGYAGAIAPMGNQKFAISTRYYGVYILDLKNKVATVLQHDPADPGSLKVNSCRRLLLTSNGTLFVHSRGLSITQLSAQQFQSQKSIVNKKGERYDAGFNSLIQDNSGKYWIATNRFLALWDRETNVSTYYPYTDVNSGPQKFRTVRSVVTDSLNRIWVGTFGGGIGRLLPGGNFKQFMRNSNDSLNTLPSNDVHAIVKDAKQHFIICANGGFTFFDPISGKITRFTNHPVLGEIENKTTFYAFADKKDNWWLAQEKGLYYYDKNANKLHQIALTGNNRATMMQVVASDSSGLIYAGGVDGLYIISPETLKVQKILRKEQGLSSNNIYGLLCDKQGKMWVLGNIGVSRYNPETGTLESFDARDGIDQSNHLLCNFFMANDGEIFFTSVEGFSFFYPDKIVSLKRPLKVFVTSIELPDTTLTMPDRSNYQLAYNENNFSFSYLAVDFKFGPSLQFRYQLLGYDKGLVYAGNQRIARYTNLPAGNYTFMVEASLNGVDWYSLPNAIVLSIEKAFWKTWLFRIVGFLLLGSLLFTFFYSKLTKFRKQESIKRDFENQLAQVKMNLLRTQMNPHFLFNSLNSINSFILKNDRQNASGYLTKFSRLMRLILDNSRSEWVTLENEIKAIELYVQLESLRFNHSFGYEINIDATTSVEHIILPPMLIQPYIENAIWHGLMNRNGPGGKLKVDIREYPKEIEVRIWDNGIGRVAAKAFKSKSALQQKSYGMKITDERMRVVNIAYKIEARAMVTDLLDEKGEACGTEVLLKLNKILDDKKS